MGVRRVLWGSVQVGVYHTGFCGFLAVRHFSTFSPFYKRFTPRARLPGVLFWFYKFYLPLLRFVLWRIVLRCVWCMGFFHEATHQRTSKQIVLRGVGKEPYRVRESTRFAPHLRQGLRLRRTLRPNCRPPHQSSSTHNRHPMWNYGRPTIHPPSTTTLITRTTIHARTLPRRRRYFQCLFLPHSRPIRRTRYRPSHILNTM